MDASYILQMKDVDIYMQESMDRYLNNDNFGGWFAEYNAVSIVCHLADREVVEAKEAKKVLLSEADLANFRRITAELSTSLYQQRASIKELELFEKNSYDNFVSWYGYQKADERKLELVTKKDRDTGRYKLAKENYEKELAQIKKTAPMRSTNYIALRGKAFADSNEDPVLMMNRVLVDVNQAYPEYAYAAVDMNDQIQKLYGNYQTDARYLDSVHSLLTDLSDNLMPSLERKMNHKEREQEIQEYYRKQYDQQIFLLKVLIFFSLLAAIGTLLLYYQLIHLTVFIVYLGAIGGVAFIVFFYYLWDFYIRDTQVFDEYQYGVYGPPSTGKVLDTSFNDNIIYC